MRSMSLGTLTSSIPSLPSAAPVKMQLKNQHQYQQIHGKMGKTKKASCKDQ